MRKRWAAASSSSPPERRFAEKRRRTYCGYEGKQDEFYEGDPMKTEEYHYSTPSSRRRSSPRPWWLEFQRRRKNDGKFQSYRSNVGRNPQNHLEESEQYRSRRQSYGPGRQQQQQHHHHHHDQQQSGYRQEPLYGEERRVRASSAHRRSYARREGGRGESLHRQESVERDGSHHGGVSVPRQSPSVPRGGQAYGTREEDDDAVEGAPVDEEAGRRQDDAEVEAGRRHDGAEAEGGARRGYNGRNEYGRHEEYKDEYGASRNARYGSDFRREGGGRRENGPRYEFESRREIGPRFETGPRYETGSRYETGPRHASGPKYETEYESGPKFENGPQRYDNGPHRYDNGPHRYDKGPYRYENGPYRYENGPHRYENGPFRYENGPPRYENRPRYETGSRHERERGYEDSYHGRKSSSVSDYQDRHRHHRPPPQSFETCSSPAGRLPDERQTGGARKAESEQHHTHLNWHVGMMLSPHLRVVGELAEGTFGRVLECQDLVRDKKVAVKVVRTGTDYADAANIEARILRETNRLDPDNASGCVRLYDSFVYQEHVCLVMERLGADLYEFAVKHNSLGFALADIRTIARDLLKCLAFFRKIGLTHTDLKPENVVFINDSVHPRVRDDRWPIRPINAHVKVIDFGSATWREDDRFSVINTRQYRAPEVILDLGWDESSDIWCLGCLLAELLTGYLLFRTHNSLQHLAMINKMIEPIPMSMLANAGPRAVDYIHYDAEARLHELNWPNQAPNGQSVRRVEELGSLESILRRGHPMFVSFIRRMLRVMPEKRATPMELLQDPFLS